MNKKKGILFIMALVLIGATSVVLARLRGNQALGRPGIKTTAIAGSTKVRIELPGQLTGYESEPIEPSAEVIRALPKDTSLAQRVYRTPDGFESAITVVLMGTDRTSIHKPQICLPGSGWKIDNSPPAVVSVRVEQPYPYDLRVIELLATDSQEVTWNGRTFKPRAVYVYWFVADGVLSADPSGLERMWSMTKGLLRTGVLQRWAYVTCQSFCEPGQEEETFDRMKRLIAASVPEFQLVPPPVAQGQAAAGRIGDL